MMKTNVKIGILLFFIAVISAILLLNNGETKEEKNEDNPNNNSNLTGTIINIKEDFVMVEDSDNLIYTFNIKDLNASVGNSIVIEYTGLLDKNKTLQNIEVIKYDVTKEASEQKKEGIFKEYIEAASAKLKTLSLEEKIGQMLLVRVPEENAIETIKNYHLGGYVFYGRDFEDLNEEEIKKKIKEYQMASSIPLLTAVDEEGGRVVRVSSNPLLREEKFKSPQELYEEGGLIRIKEDTIEKSLLLSNLGLNVNLAPVVDISTNPEDYMYDRSLGQSVDVTKEYAKTVIAASKSTNVSYTLKHFPGYGNNLDTHTGSSVDNRTLESIMENDIEPFKSGIDAGAEAVLISHNIVTSIDSTNPASLSPSVHNLLRNELNFSGIIITDDLDMGATKDIKASAVKSILAGNDILITTDYEKSFNEIKGAIENGEISKEQVDTIVTRILAWKYYKGLLYDNQK